MKNYTTVEYEINHILQDNPYCNLSMRLKYIYKIKDFITTSYSEFKPYFKVNNTMELIPVAYNIRLSWDV